MIRSIWVLAMAALVATACGQTLPAGHSAATTPCVTTATAPTTSPATTSAPAVDEASMAILRRMEQAGERYPLVQADVDYHVLLIQVSDEERRTGRVYYQAATAGKNGKFRIHFETFRQGDGPLTKSVEDYAFDGEWFTSRKERIKTIERSQIAPPGKTVNPLQLGKGPFPIPFGQKAETVGEFFRVTTRPPAASDPPGTDYLKLVRLPGREKDINTPWIEMWVQRDPAAGTLAGLPVKIVSEDDSKNRTTATFKGIESPKTFPAGTFDLPRPGSDWEVHIW